MSDQEITLSLGDQMARIAPFGASLRAYSRAGRDIVWGYSGRENKKGGQGDVLFPFPGRIRHGQYSWNGMSLQLPRNDKDGPNAIHGFARLSEWETREVSPTHARFRFALREDDYREKGYPFSIGIELTYSLNEEGLRCDFRVQNLGKSVAPVGIGFHPYFTVGTGAIDSAQAEIPAAEFIEFGDDLLPTGAILPIEQSPCDFRKARVIGGTLINHCLTAFSRDARGLAWMKLRDPATGVEVRVWMDSAFDYLVIYTGDTIPGGYARRAFAIEPMTCATDAYNRPEWGLKRLEAGESWSGSWGCQCPCP